MREDVEWKKRTWRVRFEGLDKDFIVVDYTEDYAIDRALREMSEEDNAILSKRILVMGEAEEIDPIRDLKA
ncbi:MAG: hypothetical protein MJ238_02310 [Bacilli bacterium]|nr:hypothetical protein [Bacilli bacterium]